MHLLFSGDCREILPSLPKNSVHLVVTSPPYNLKTDYAGYTDDLPFSAYWQFTKEWLTDCFRLLIDGGRIAVNLPLSTRLFGDCFFPMLYRLMRERGFDELATIVWVKRYSDSGRLMCRRKLYGSVGSPKSPYFRDACELIVVMRKSGNTFPVTQPPDLTHDEYAQWTQNVWEIPPESNRIFHPAPFPLQLPFRLIKLLTVKGNVVLDPFIGSGTTMKAADRLERTCIGCELSQQYQKLTRQRVGWRKVQQLTPEDLQEGYIGGELSHVWTETGGYA